MSSTFVNSKKTIKGFMGKEYPIPIYLQFVPGYVVDVVHNEDSEYYETNADVNAIIAIPHIYEGLSISGKRRSTVNPSNLE